MFEKWLYIPIVFTSLLIVGCAQVKSISGGEKDTSPPRLVAATPESKTLRFTGNSFTLAFDEYIQLRDLQKEMLISPPLALTPRVKVRLRNVEVSWDDTLRSETTYIFQFGKSITDVNESNPLNDFSYVFSTGSRLDSLMCSGRVFDAFIDKPVSAAKVLLFDSLQHVFNPDARPAYFARTNDKGEFRFDYLRSGQYVLCSLSDENGNNHFDMGESVDWKEGVIATRDSIGHELFMSTPRDTVVRGFNYVTDSSGVLKFRVEPWFPSTRVISLGTDSIVQWVQKDTLYAALNAVCEGRWDIAVVCDEKTLDTLSIQHIADEKSGMKAIALFSPKMKTTDSVVVKTYRPIVTVDDSFLKCYKDSLEIGGSSGPIGALQRAVHLQNKPGKTYSVIALPGWLTDDCGETNDTLRVRFSVYEAKDLGGLRFNLPKSSLSGSFVFQLLDRSENVVVEQNPIRSLEFEVGQLVPGDYTARICRDSNGNGYFDPLQLNPLIKTERNYVYGAAIQAKANWEVVIDWPEFEE
jgi:uncharacterized protein (DUF2141 family)